MKFLFLILLNICFLSSFNLYSQNIEHNQSKYELSYNDYIYTGAGAVLILVGDAINSNLKVPVQADIDKLSKNNIPSFERFVTENYSTNSGKVSDILLIANFLSPSLLLLDNDFRANEIPNVIYLYIEATALNVGINSLAKSMAQRARPYTYNPFVLNDVKLQKDAFLSFYSGHTCVSFCGAVFLSKVYSDLYPNSEYKNWVWGVSLSSATATAYLRVAAGQHFLTDVIVGAAVGSAIGYLVPELHKKSIKDSKNIGEIKFNLTPKFEYIPEINDFNIHLVNFSYSPF